MRLKPIKPVVDHKTSISVFELTQSAVFKERLLPRYKFRLGETEVLLIRCELEHDWYLELLNPRPKRGDTTINLLKTPCNYGGHRYWLECPKCLKRAGMLYWEEDVLRCRTCLSLGYWSQKMNYGTLIPTFRRWSKLKKMDTGRCRFYRGKPTKYAQRYEKIRAQVNWGIDALGNRYARGEETKRKLKNRQCTS